MQKKQGTARASQPCAINAKAIAHACLCTKPVDTPDPVLSLPLGDIVPILIAAPDQIGVNSLGIAR